MVELDRAPTRGLLSWAATLRARQLVGKGARIWYEDGIWMHQAGHYAVPDGPRFDYYDSTFVRSEDEIATYFRNAEDYWFSHYRPKYGDVIIDVGAGRGEDSLPFARAVGPAGRVLAIEADAGSYRLLERLCVANHLDNVKPLHIALMDKLGVVRTGDSSDLWQQTTVAWSALGVSGTTTAATLDEICRREQLDNIDFLKMNIEGAETLALIGMENTISSIRHICVCCHDFRADRGHGDQYRTRKFVEEFLANAGFRLSFRQEAPYDFLRDHVYGARDVAS